MRFWRQYPMNLFHLAYIGLTTIVSVFLAPRLRRHPEKQAEMAQRLAIFPDSAPCFQKRRPLIWMHAVSVGEVAVADATLKALEAEDIQADILVTTTTATGQCHARNLLKNRAMVRFAPLDIWTGVGRFLAFYQPDLLVCVETEIWPNWIIRASSAGIPVVMVNGRISARSIRTYRWIRPLLRPVLQNVAAFSMISQVDADRIVSLGAPVKRVRVNGNVKMDAQQTHLDETALSVLKQVLGVNEKTPVFVAGSVRSAEFAAMLEVYVRLSRQINNLMFIIAPRHLKKIPKIVEMADAQGLVWQYRTALEPAVQAHAGEKQRASLLILDTMGELRQVYGLASVVFCGGSLVPLGGQNVLEPAMWAKPVLFGPFMDDFADAARLLETSGGGICVADADALFENALYLLTHPEKAHEKGKQAQKAVFSVTGAARRHAQVMARVLEKRV